MKKIVFMLSVLMFLGAEKVFAEFNFFSVTNKAKTTAEDSAADKKETDGIMKNVISVKKSNSIGGNNPIVEKNNSDDSVDFFSGFIEDVEAEQKAKDQAKLMLKEDLKIIKLRQSQIKELERNKVEREKLRQKFIDREQAKMKPEEKVQNILDTFETAPLGLNWGISVDKMKQIGYEIEEIEREDYPNSYIVKNYTQKFGKGYENVIVSFGENDELWCINAQTSAVEDEPNAKETLKLYNKYYDALSGKYGNAVEHFTPYTYEQKITEGEGDEIVTRIVKKSNSRGNPDFLKELQTGKAELYATFHNSSIGVTLSVYIDENGLGQVVLDYKNLILMKKEKEAFVNNL